MGQSLGLPITASKPHTSEGRTHLGSAASQSSGCGSSSTGCHFARAHAGSSSARGPCGPVSGRSQCSTRVRPDQPLMTVPRITIGSPAANLTGPSSIYAAVLRYDSGSLPSSAYVSLARKSLVTTIRRSHLIDLNPCAHGTTIRTGPPRDSGSGSPLSWYATNGSSSHGGASITCV